MLMISSALLVVVLFQNIDASSFQFLFWEFTAPKIFLFIIMLSVGVALGFWYGSNDKVISVSLKPRLKND